MNNRRLFLIVGLALAGSILPASLAWATGTLAISAVVKNPATTASPASLSVTGTCVQSTTLPVKVKLVDAVNGTVFTPWSSAGCGYGAATSGKTVTFLTSAIPAGTYKVALKQGSSVAWWMLGTAPQTVTLP